MPWGFAEGLQESLGRFFCSGLGNCRIEFLELLGCLRQILVKHSGRNIDARVFVQKHFLLFGPLVDRRFVGGAQHGAKRLFELHQLFVQGILDELGFLGCALGTDGLSFHFDFRRKLDLGLGDQGDQAFGGRFPCDRVKRWSQDCSQGEVVFMGKRIVAVVMALRAIQTRSQKGTADHLKGICNRFVASLWRIIATCRSVGGHPQESRRGQKLDLGWGPIALFGTGKFIPCKLLDDEPIDGLVLIQ